MRRDRFRSRRLSFLLIVGLGLSVARVGEAREEAPRLEFKPPLEAGRGLEARISFWVDVFTRYSLAEAIVHDRDRPWVVFAVVPLADGGSAELEAIQERYSALADRVGRALAHPERSGSRRVLGPKGEAWAMLRPPMSPRLLAEARGRIRVQTGQREVFRESVVRSKAYLSNVRRLLRDASLPEELAYLPHVESSFDALAVSRAGAVGLWQLMPDTARGSLRVDDGVDERRDPYKATAVAARYLHDAHEALGSWPLAITSYNYGVNGTLRAVATAGTSDLVALIERHASPAFGYAGKNFYAQFLAAVHIARNATYYFPGIETRAAREYVVRKGDTLWQIARKNGTTVKALRSANRAVSAQLQLGQRLLIYG
ncbi:MAG TPA: transglycosylase SLT domain-containing protein [Candidatus Binatia bacterium]|nr:transglycosylase SLT domain-containing protein [Candidatus Binatia bacterium]